MEINKKIVKDRILYNKHLDNDMIRYLLDNFELRKYRKYNSGKIESIIKLDKDIDDFYLIVWDRGLDSEQIFFDQPVKVKRYEYDVSKHVVIWGKG